MVQQILITGCQRSGTTLLNLILDSHPGILGVDEMDFEKYHAEKSKSGTAGRNRLVSLKLPMAAHSLEFIAGYDISKILWCVRDPRDVVASMINLQGDYQDRPLVFAANPYGALGEISACLEALRDQLPTRLEQPLSRYRELLTKSYFSWEHRDMVLSSALCWVLKNQMPSRYDEAGIPYLVINYEKLVADPEKETRKVTNYLGLEWNDRLLKHHLLHHGISVGMTDNTRPVDSRSIGRWRNEFSPEELHLIQTICEGTANCFGYQLDV